MHIESIKSARVFLSVLASGLWSGGVLAQHVHGVIELGVVIDGETVAVSLSAPLSDVVGFEHEPQDEQQTELLRQAAMLLSSADGMFGLTAAAACSATAPHIDVPVYMQALMQSDLADADSGDHRHRAHDADDVAGHDSHARSEHDADEHDSHEHDARDEQHSHGDDEDAEVEHHAEVDADYVWTCGDVSRLNSIDLHFTETFASVDKIEVQVLTTSAASVTTLDGRAASISLVQDSR